MLNFFEELKEARLFRGRETLKGKTADELGKVLYLMFMMIEILRAEDKLWAIEYVTNTMADEQFTSMRSNSTDMHNLIAILSNQNKYEGRITTNYKISPPLLQIKRYFRDILNDRKLRGVDRSFFKSLEDFLQISNGEFKNVRRTVADWNLASDTEKHTVRYAIKNLIRPTNQQNDLLIHFFDKLRG